MEKRTTLQGGVFIYYSELPVGLVIDRFIEGSEGFQRAIQSCNSFAFEPMHCGLTVRKESKQRGDLYWYAYKEIDGLTYKRYVGKNEVVSSARLWEIYHRIAVDSTGRRKRRFSSEADS